MLPKQSERSLGVVLQTERSHTADGFDVVAQSLLLRFAAVWQASRSGDGFPARRDLDPAQFPWALRFLYVVDRVPAPDYWRYRLAGNDISGAFRRNTFKGTSLRDLMSEDAFPIVQKRWEPVFAGPVAVYMNGSIYRNADRYCTGGRLLLPLAEERGRTVTGLVGLSVTDENLSVVTDDEALDVYHIAV